MTQTYKVQVSMNQAHIVESGFVWKQGDFGFNIEIEVLDFDTTGATPQIIFRKSTGAVEATQISVAGNKFTYAIRGTELDTPGPCVCDLKLNDSTTKRVSTASFKYFVIPDTMDGLAEESSSYSDTIANIVDGFNDDLKEINKDIRVIEKSISAGLTSLNKFDLSQSRYHKFINNDGSIVDESGNYLVSNIIRVEPNMVLLFVEDGTATKFRGCVGFDYDGNVVVPNFETISYYYYNTNAFPVYLMFNLWIDRAEDDGMILEIPYIHANMFNPSYIEIYTKYLIPTYQSYNLVPITKEKLDANTSSIQKMIEGITGDLIFPVNIYDKTKTLLNTWMYSDGHVGTDNAYNLSDYIPVPAGACVVYTGRDTVALATRKKIKARTPIIFNQYKQKTAMGTDNKSFYYNDTDAFQYIRLNISNTLNDIMVSYSDYNGGDPAYPNTYLEYGEIRTRDIIHSELLPEQKDMFKAERDDVIADVLDNSRKKGLIFTLVSDTHYNPFDFNNERRTRDTFANIKAVNERIYTDFIVHCGDFVTANYEGLTIEQADGIINSLRSMMLAGNKRVFMVNGNHDGPNGGTPRSMNYNCIGTHNDSYVVRNLNYSWYYSDNTILKIRMIFLETNSFENNQSIWGISNTQLSWLTETLNNTPTDYDLMIFSHIGTFDPDFQTNKDAVCALFNAFHNHTGDYSSMQGKCICWFCGHEHFDWIVPSSKSGLDFPMYVITASGMHASFPDPSLDWEGVETPYPRTDGTLLQDAWDVVVYDQEQKIIKTFRFGAGNDHTIDLNSWDNEE